MLSNLGKLFCAIGAEQTFGKEKPLQFAGSSPWNLYRKPHYRGDDWLFEVSEQSVCTLIPRYWPHLVIRFRL